METREQRLERLAQTLQGRIGQVVAEKEGQIAMLLLEIEDKDKKIAELEQEREAD